jgi:hypothetical protein
MAERNDREKKGKEKDGEAVQIQNLFKTTFGAQVASPHCPILRMKKSKG